MAGLRLAVLPQAERPGIDREVLSAYDAALDALARSTGEMGIILGCAARNPRSTGKPLHNAAALLHRGRLRALRAKTLLPTYDVFDERRYFEPALSNAPLRFKGLRIGLSICEDAWARAPGTISLLLPG